MSLSQTTLPMAVCPMRESSLARVFEGFRGPIDPMARILRAFSGISSNSVVWGTKSHALQRRAVNISSIL